jgi:hypothetical protein
MKCRSDEFKCPGEFIVPLLERKEHRKEPLDLLGFIMMHPSFFPADSVAQELIAFTALFQ